MRQGPEEPAIKLDNLTHELNTALWSVKVPFELEEEIGDWLIELAPYRLHISEVLKEIEKGLQYKAKILDHIKVERE